MITSTSELQEICCNYVPGIDLDRGGHFDKVYLYVPEPEFHEPERDSWHWVDIHPYLSWAGLGKTYRLYLHPQQEGSDTSLYLNGRRGSETYYYLANHHVPLRELSLYHLGRSGSFADYRAYRGIWVLNWEGVRDHLPFGAWDCSILHSAGTVGQERLDAVLREFYIEPPRRIPVGYFTNILLLRPSPDVIRDLFDKVPESRTVFFQGFRADPMGVVAEAEAMRVAIRAGVLPDFRAFQDRMGYLRELVAEVNDTGERPTVWEHLAQ